MLNKDLTPFMHSLILENAEIKQAKERLWWQGGSLSTLVNSSSPAYYRKKEKMQGL